MRRLARRLTLHGPMPGQLSGDAAERLAQVQRLATELAARVRYAQIVARSIPPDHIAALVEAARLLQERGEPWPPLVGEVLQRIVEDMEQPGHPEGAPDDDSIRDGGALGRGRAPLAETEAT